MMAETFEIGEYIRFTTKYSHQVVDAKIIDVKRGWSNDKFQLLFKSISNGLEYQTIEWVPRSRVFKKDSL